MIRRLFTLADRWITWREDRIARRHAGPHGPLPPLGQRKLP